MASLLNNYLLLFLDAPTCYQDCTTIWLVVVEVYKQLGAGWEVMCTYSHPFEDNFVNTDICDIPI